MTISLLVAVGCDRAEHPAPARLEETSPRKAGGARTASPGLGVLPGSKLDAAFDGHDGGYTPGSVSPEGGLAPDASLPEMDDAVSDAGGAAGPLPNLDAAPIGSSDSMSEYAVLVSIDGLAPRFVEQLVNANKLPALSQVMRRGAWTHEARTSPGSSVTLPNHFSMITSRPVLNNVQSSTGGGHQFTINSAPAVGQTIHSSSEGGYVPSIFDLVHDRGGRTALFAGKSKFIAFAEGYGPEHGAPDLYAGDDGQNKIDVASVEGTPPANEVVASFIEEAKESPIHFTFLHMTDPDGVGHSYGWGSPEYLSTLENVDRALAKLMSFLDTTEPYKGRVHVVITADHGGDGYTHLDAENALNFTIPMYVVSPTVSSEQDLYALAGALRTKPPVGVYASAAGPPPLHNADAGNLCATLMGLPEIPYSPLHSFHQQGKWPYQTQAAVSSP